MRTTTTRIPCSILQDSGSRYILRQVNYCLFLYDKQDDIYIPIEVVAEILSRKEGAEQFG